MTTSFLPERVPLRAGPLTLFYEQGDLRAIRLGETEILQRVYVAVRDPEWRTLPNTIRNVEMQHAERSFSIRYDAETREGDIDFRWQVSMTGSEDGSIRWKLEGHAARSFWKNRVGFCVLHPTREWAGQPCVVETEDSAMHRGEFPLRVAPHQPFFAIRTISHEVQRGLVAEVRFAGDEFEMEDQRNWTDGSYKIYSTPLALPFPAQMLEGSRVAQSVTLSLQGQAPPTKTEPQMRLVLAGESAPLPEIGLGLSREPTAFTPLEISRLRTLGLAHLRVDLHLARARWEAELQSAAIAASDVGAGLECALFLTSEAPLQLTTLASSLRDVAGLVKRWVVFHESEAVTAPRWIAMARQILGPLTPQAQFVAGTDRNFADLNRNRPPVESLDAVCFPVMPQAHAIDTTSLIDNAAASGDCVRTAREFTSGLPVVVSPVTLQPRDKEDPRHASLLGAAWTAASLQSLSAARAVSVTYYEAIGSRGLMASGGNVFPTWFLFALLAEFRGGEVLTIEPSDPLQFSGLVLQRGGRRVVVLVSFSAELQKVQIEKVVPTGAVTVEVLDPEQLQWRPSVLPLGTLPPFSIVKIDGRRA